MSEISLTNVVLFVVGVVPGLVSAQVYRLLMPARPLEWKDAFSQGLFYSVLNFVVLFPVAIFVAHSENHSVHPWLYWLAVVGLFVLAPVAWPFVFRALLQWQWLRPKINLPYPTPWDFVFLRRDPAFLLIRMNDGKMLGGYWGPSSYAGSFPNDGDIYLEAVYHLDEQGVFGHKISGTRGLLVRKDQYLYVELLAVPTPTEEA